MRIEMSIAISLILVVFFLLMNAFFVVAEFSLVRIRKSQVDMLVANGAVGAKYAQLVSNNVNAYLSACQLGITLASLALGWLGEPAISDLIRPLLEPLGLSSAMISTIAVAIGFIVMTALHIVVGELIPKSLAIFSTERWALRSAPLLVWFYRLTYPMVPYVSWDIKPLMKTKRILTRKSNCSWRKVVTAVFLIRNSTAIWTIFLI